MRHGHHLWLTASHELRTPLNAILGWARILSEGILDPATNRRAVESISRNAHSMLAIIEDALEVSRDGNAATRVARARIEMSELVQLGVDTVTPAAAMKGVHVSCSANPEPTVVLGDPNRLNQVIGNVLTNAINYTPEGGRVRVTVARTDRDAEIRVMDTGAGIEPDLLPYVFERYRRGPSSSQAHECGLGLGLAIARQLVELHGGTIHAESGELQHGTTIVIKLPLDSPASLPGRTVTRADAANSVLEERPVRIRGVHVLVLDDSDDTRALTAAVLSRYGANVRACAAVSAAKRMITTHPPDVVLMSLGRDESDGYKLIRWLRTGVGRSRTVPAGALTGYVRLEDRTRALMAGFQTVIRKPVEHSELVAAVAALAALRGGAVDTESAAAVPLSVREPGRSRRRVDV
jgi:CheY-like chemotaxis protein/two-component sensor histidine kinase